MLKSIYNETVTIFNKLKRTDSFTGKDIWFKTVLHDVAWYTDVEREPTNSSIYIGKYHTILIPFHNEFLPYIQWRELGNQDEHYTMSMGDYIVKGNVEEDFTAENIVKGLERYGENVCLVKFHEQKHDRFGATVQLRIEGV